jgi:hypothetical protein
MHGTQTEESGSFFLLLLRKPRLFRKGTPPDVLLQRMHIRQNHLGRRKRHSRTDQRMGPVRRDGTGCELREHGAHKGFWVRDEQRRAADFRHGRSLQGRADAFNEIQGDNNKERRRTTKYVFTCSTVTPLGVSSAVSESDQVRRKALLPE